MKKATLFITALLSMAVTAGAKNVAIEAPGNTLVVGVTNGQRPMFVYYGAKLSASDMANLKTGRRFFEERDLSSLRTSAGG